MTCHNSHSIRDLSEMQLSRAAALGVAMPTLRKRLSRSWSIERATGQLPYLRSRDGERQKYIRPTGGKWSRLAHSSGRFAEERRTVEAICREEGFPVPRFLTPGRRSPWMPKTPPRSMPEPIVTDAHHRDA